MAGQPITRQQMKVIEGAGGAEYLLAQIAGGKTIVDLAGELSVSRQLISGMLNSPDNVERLKDARKQAAAVYAEQSLGIADQAQPETERVARLQIDTRRWLASKFDREGFGENAGPAVVVNVQTLHIDALRQRSAELREAAKQITASVDMLPEK